VDFGEADFFENGVRHHGHYLNLSFPYSNAGYLQLFKGEIEDADSILATFRRLNTESFELSPTVLPTSIPVLPAVKNRAGDYDLFLTLSVNPVKPAKTGQTKKERVHFTTTITSILQN